MTTQSLAPRREAGADELLYGRVGRVRGRMATIDPRAALRADVVLALAQARGGDIRYAAELVRTRGIHLHADVPSLMPAADFYARHSAVISARLDEEVARTGRRDLNDLVRSWGKGYPGSLRETEERIVEHVVLTVVREIDGSERRALREAERLYESAAERVAAEERPAEVVAVRPARVVTDDLVRAINDQGVVYGPAVEFAQEQGYEWAMEMGDY